MTADSASWVAESASSTIDPDVRARLASDGVSAGIHSDLTLDDYVVDELAAEFEENRADGELYAECRRPAEQAALRRLATIVARGVEPVEVFGALAEEMRRCVPADAAGLWRFESDREITVVAAAADPEALARWPVGTRTPVKANTLATLVHRSGRPARIDSYDNVAGPIAARMRAVLSSRNPLTLWTSGEPPRGPGSIPHAGGSRHQHRCGAEIPAPPTLPRAEPLTQCANDTAPSMD